MATHGVKGARGSELRRPCLKAHRLPPESSLPTPVLSRGAPGPVSTHGCQEPILMPCGPTPPHPPEPCRPVAPGQQLRGRYGVDSNTNRDNVPFLKDLFGNRKWTGWRGGMRGHTVRYKNPIPVRIRHSREQGLCPPMHERRLCDMPCTLGIWRQNKDWTDLFGG